MGGVVGRFAPTPSGRMHLGNLFSCLIAWLSARSQGGRIVMRMEDLDPQRTSREYASQLMLDLERLGLTWDEGPYWQSERSAYYQECLDKLEAQEMVYKCFCSRAELHSMAINLTAARQEANPTANLPAARQEANSAANLPAARQEANSAANLPAARQEANSAANLPAARQEANSANAPHASDGDYIYSGRCRDLTVEQIAALEGKRTPALRLRVEGQVDFTDRHYGPMSYSLPQDCGDFILRRSDGVFAYQLAVTADDGAMGITEVVRGRDLLSSAPRQLYLFKLLGLCSPEYAHIPMLLAPDGRRLSKREKDMDVGVLLERFQPEALLGRLAYLAGQLERPEPVMAEELVPLFNWDRVPKEDIYLPEDLMR